MRSSTSKNLYFILALFVLLVLISFMINRAASSKSAETGLEPPTVLYAAFRNFPRAA